MAPSTLTLDELAGLAGQVCDPELPPLTLTDLGILRGVERDGDTVVVTLTPTYSGCPAVEYIEDQVRVVIETAGVESVRVERAFTPPWTTDWITEEGRAKMTAAGIAPPLPIEVGPAPADGGEVPVRLGRRLERLIACPRCGSGHTTELSAFGSTSCKALYRCDACTEPFDYFKDI